MMGIKEVVQIEFIQKVKSNTGAVNQGRSNIGVGYK